MRYSWIIPIILILFLLPLSNAQTQSQVQFNVQGIPSTYAVENSSINIIIYYYDSNNNLIQEVSYTIPFAFSFYLNLNYSSNADYFKISYPELTAFYNSLEIYNFWLDHRVIDCVFHKKLSRGDIALKFSHSPGSLP